MVHADQDKTRTDVMRLVPLVAREGRRIAEVFAEHHGLHVTDVEALSCIIRAEAQHTPVTAGVLGSELGLTSGATTFLMTRLERAGLIERTRDPHDQRRVQLSLSAAGRELAAAIHPPFNDASMAVMGEFTALELETVRRFLTATTTAMTAYRTSLSTSGSNRLHRSSD